MSERAYLETELESETRHEYVAGQVFAMVGASRTHNRISGNIYSRLLAHLRGSACSVFMSEVKVSVPAKSAYYYPDVVATSDPRDRLSEQESYVVTAPVPIVEVLSRSTETIDRREKLLAYQALDSLREYMLVGQSEQRVEDLSASGSGLGDILTQPGRSGAR